MARFVVGIIMDGGLLEEDEECRECRRCPWPLVLRDRLAPECVPVVVEVLVVLSVASGLLLPVVAV